MTDATHFGFETALVAIKHGKRVSRAEWNCKGQFVQIWKGWADGAKWGFDADNKPAWGHPSLQNAISIGLFNMPNPGDTRITFPYLCMRTAQDNRIEGWAPSQIDMLAEDWFVTDANWATPVEE